MKVRDSEAQSHLSTGTLAKYLAHLRREKIKIQQQRHLCPRTYSHNFQISELRVRCGGGNKCGFGHTVYLDVSSEGKTSVEGSLDMNTYTCQQMIS